MLIVPPIGWKVASGGGGGGYSVTMTAADYAGFLVGYFPLAASGSIDVEPIPGETLASIVSLPGQASVVQFVGDITHLLIGLHVWVEGVNMAGGPWSYVSESGTTEYAFGNGSEFTDGNVYFIEIK